MFWWDISQCLKIPIAPLTKPSWVLILTVSMYCMPGFNFNVFFIPPVLLTGISSPPLKFDINLWRTWGDASPWHSSSAMEMNGSVGSMPSIASSLNWSHSLFVANRWVMLKSIGVPVLTSLWWNIFISALDIWPSFMFCKATAKVRSSFWRIISVSSKSWNGSQRTLSAKIA